MPNIAPSSAPAETSLFGRARSIIKIWRGGRPSDDQPWSEAMVADLIRSAWSALLDEQVRAGAGIDPQVLVPVEATLSGHHTIVHSAGNLTRAWWSSFPLANVVGVPWVESVVTEGGVHCTPASSELEAILAVKRKPYAGQPAPSWYIRPGAQARPVIYFVLPPRFASLSAARITVLPLRLDVDATGTPLHPWSPCAMLDGPRWEAVRTYVLGKYGPTAVNAPELIDAKNDGAPGPKNQP